MTLLSRDRGERELRNRESSRERSRGNREPNILKNRDRAGTGNRKFEKIGNGREPKLLKAGNGREPGTDLKNTKD